MILLRHWVRRDLCPGLKPALSFLSTIQVATPRRNDFDRFQGGTGNSSIPGNSWQLDSASNYTHYDDVRITYVPGQGINRFVPPPVLPQGLWTNNTFWEYMGVLFEGLHWMFLADFGQTQSTEYPLFDGYNTTNIDFSGAELFPSTNNIFANSTLYQSTLRMMAYGLTESYDNRSFADVGLNLPVLKADDFPLALNETVLVQSYYCQQRQLKHPASLLATLLAADYVLIIGGYKLVTWIAELVEKRRAQGIASPPDPKLTFSKLLPRTSRW